MYDAYAWCVKYEPLSATDESSKLRNNPQAQEEEQEEEQRSAAASRAAVTVPKKRETGPVLPGVEGKNPADFFNPVSWYLINEAAKKVICTMRYRCTAEGDCQC